MKHISFFAGRQLSVWAGVAAILAVAGLPDTVQSAGKDVPMPQIQPGTFKINVRARAADGAKPIGSQCDIQWDHGQAEVPSQTQPKPVVEGADGDWVIYNVTPDHWYVTIQADDFAWSFDANTKRLNLRKAEDVSLNFTLLRGSTVKGKVVDGVTGKPIKGALVTGGDWDRCRDETDAHGQFTVKHLNAGKSVSMRVRKDGYVPVWSPQVAVQEGETGTVADTKLLQGGWISGRIIAPADAPQDGSVTGGVMPKFEDQEKQWPQSAIGSINTTDRKHTFRLGPLQPGAYTLEAWLGTGKPWPGHPYRSWKGKVQHVQVEAGKETKNVEIAVQESKK